MPDRLDLDLGVCEVCGHSVSEHIGAWCRHRMGKTNDAGRELICCCLWADAERAVLAATVAERDRLAEIVKRAALETYTPDGSEIIVQQMLRIVGERDEARATVRRVRDLASQWNGTPDYMPSDYDQGRVDQRHCMTTELLEAVDDPRERS